MSIWADMAPVSRSMICSILKKYPLGTRNDYVAKNELTTYICVNTWLLCVKKWSPFGYIALKDAILREGLSAIIERASVSADEIIHDQPISDSLFRGIMQDVDVSLFSHPANHAIGRDKIATQLFLLRYAKRYTPIGPDALYESSLKAFVDNDRRLRELQQTEFPHWLIESMRGHIAGIDFDAVMERFDTYEINLSPGITLDSSSAKLGSKLLAIAKDTPEMFIQPFGVPMCGFVPSVPREYFGVHPRLYEKKVTRAICVPKSYKASRIIFPETTVRQSNARQLFDLMCDVLPNEIPIHHQENNQQLCKVPGYASIDWTAASDSICKVLLWELFPYDFAKLVDKYLPTHYTINGKERLLHGLATSGNALTFILESIIFWSLAKTSVDYASLFLGFCNDTVSVYGDDVVVPDDAAELCIQFGELLGFLPNASKSFYGDMPYRESCGKEYYKGQDTSCVYYPRTPIQGTLKPLTLSNKIQREGWPDIRVFDSTQSLIRLQHELYPISLEASTFLKELIKECHPKMTSSLYGEEAFDVWDYESTHTRHGIPSASVRHDDYRTVKWKYSNVMTDDLYRIHKYGPRVKSLSTDGRDDWERLLNLYNYQSFLRYGPRYED